jgi:hypothetical protein
MQMALLDSCGSRLDDALDAMACLRHGVPQEHHLAPLHRRTLPRAQPEAGRACWLRDAAVPDFSVRIDLIRLDPTVETDPLTAS